jgi:hypothetical protein
MSWLSVKCDELPTATGLVYVLVTNNGPKNYIYSFKKLDGSRHQFFL